MGVCVPGWGGQLRKAGASFSSFSVLSLYTNLGVVIAADIVDPARSLFGGGEYTYGVLRLRGGGDRRGQYGTPLGLFGGLDVGRSTLFLSITELILRSGGLIATLEPIMSGRHEGAPTTLIYMFMLLAIGSILAIRVMRQKRRHSKRQLEACVLVDFRWGMAHLN